MYLKSEDRPFIIMHGNMGVLWISNCFLFFSLRGFLSIFFIMKLGACVEIRKSIFTDILLMNCMFY